MSYPKEKAESYSLLGGINTKASPYVNGPMEFRDLTNLDFQTPGALTKRYGTALYNGATVQGKIGGGVEFERLNGASYVIVTANTNAFSVTNSFSSIRTGLSSGGITDFVVFVDRLFAADGSSFWKYDGSNSTNFGIPDGQPGFGVTGIVGGGLSGIYLASYGYLNDRAAFGPGATGITISLNGSTFGTIGYFGLTTPPGYGISALAFYRSTAGGVDLTGTTLAAAGTTSFNDPGFPLTTRIDTEALWFTLVPKYLEIYNNQLFMAGFSSLPSTVYWSDVGEPEGSIDPTFFNEFRTNDGDRVTGLKSYNGAIVISKERSIHRLGGENPSNFLAQEISDQYGCISNNTLVTFENFLWFLDGQKGIVEFNGANIRVVSNKVEPIFRAMNVDAAREKAWGLHNKEKNQVWFGIPVGTTINNTIVVYDYLSEAWTKYFGVNASSAFIARGSLAGRTPFVGGYTGALSYFGATMYGDNGAGITCSFDSRFLAARGQTIEDQYRRFYLNVNPILGVTQAIDVNFRTNYGDTIQISRTMYQNPFQSRVDFGLSARSIQAEIFHSSASLPLTIFGYAFESRFQRNV